MSHRVRSYSELVDHGEHVWNSSSLGNACKGIANFFKSYGRAYEDIRAEFWRTISLRSW